MHVESDRTAAPLLSAVYAYLNSPARLMNLIEQVKARAGGILHPRDKKTREVGQFARGLISLAPGFSQVMRTATLTPNRFQRFTMKPLKRLGLTPLPMITALKCGANENFNLNHK